MKPWRFPLTPLPSTQHFIYSIISSAHVYRARAVQRRRPSGPFSRSTLINFVTMSPKILLLVYLNALR